MVSCLTATAAQAWTGKVVGISDGDTIKVLHDGKQVKIRLYGVDAPEKGQAFGNRAKEFTVALVAGKTVDVETITTDRYGRAVGLVTVDGKLLDVELAKAGMAWVYRKYCARSHYITTLSRRKPQQETTGLVFGQNLPLILHGNGDILRESHKPKMSIKQYFTGTPAALSSINGTASISAVRTALRNFQTGTMRSLQGIVLVGFASRRNLIF